MTVPEVAILLEVDPATVYLLCQQRMIEHRRIGTRRGTIRITESAVMAFLASATIPVDPLPPVSSAEVSEKVRKASKPRRRSTVQPESAYPSLDAAGAMIDAQTKRHQARSKSL